MELVEDDFLENGPSNPVLSNTYANAFFGIPANGAVYKFARNTTAVEEINNPLSDIRVFPNPASGNVIIDLTNVNNNTKNLKITITNLLGKTILEKEINGQTTVNLDFIEQPAGIYFVKIYDETSTFIHKIMVQ